MATIKVTSWVLIFLSLRQCLVQIEQRVHWPKESGRVEVDGDFIFRNSTRTIDPRDWSSLERSQRKIEYVSELEKAVQLTVRETVPSLSMTASQPVWLLLVLNALRRLSNPG